MARVTALTGQGHTRHWIGVALAAGLLVRVRRDWVCLPGAGAHLVSAARHGVVISCVTAARRLGLWVADQEPAPHVAYPGRGKVRKLQGAVVHWHRAIVPRHPDALVDAVENVLMTVAVCQPYEKALVIWESALNKGLVDLPSLSLLPWTGAARTLVRDATPWPDSGLESMVASRLRWLGLRIVPQAWILGRRVDFLIGARLVLQIDGRQHAGAQRVEDNRHDAELRLRGYHVIRVSYEQVMFDWPAVQENIMRAVAQGRHLAT